MYIQKTTKIINGVRMIIISSFLKEKIENMKNLFNNFLLQLEYVVCRILYDQSYSRVFRKKIM
jgi:hypothetical protein